MAKKNPKRPRMLDEESDDEMIARDAAPNIRDGRTIRCESCATLECCFPLVIAQRITSSGKLCVLAERWLCCLCFDRTELAVTKALNGKD